MLKTPESGRHGLISDKAGNIRYTGISKRHIVVRREDAIERVGVM